MKTNPQDPNKPKHLRPQVQRGKYSPSDEGKSKVDDGLLNRARGDAAARKDEEEAG